MSENLLWIMAAIPSVFLVGIAAYFAVSRHYRMKGYEPIVDYDKLQAALDAEFAPISRRAM